MRSFTAVAAALGVAVFVAGCSATGIGPATSTKSAPSQSAETPTPSPIPVKPELDQLVLSTEGLGPLELGKPVADTDPATSVVTLDQTLCVGLQRDEKHVIKSGDADAGAWVANYPKVAKAANGGGAPFTLQVGNDNAAGDPIHPTRDAAVLVIAVWDPNIRTASGISIGSTLTELKAAYPNVSQGSRGFSSTDWVVKGNEGELVFEVANSGEDYWPKAQVGRVLWMFDAPVGSHPVPIAATGGIQPCPDGDQ